MKKDNRKSDDLITNSSTRYEHYVHLALEYISKSRNNLLKLEKKCIYQINEIAFEMAECLKSGNKILICGNGGSASDALHIAAELVGRFKLERKALPCIALNENVSTLTAIGNDYGYDSVFSRQVEAFGVKGDIFIGISTSGNSKNVVEALKKARLLNLKTIGFTGGNGGAMNAENLCDISLLAPSCETSRIQELHITSGHIICKLVEEILFSAEQS